MDITFISGETYTYFDVPMGVYAGLVDAQSAGGYYNDHIRDRYRFRKTPHSAENDNSPASP